MNKNSKMGIVRELMFCLSQTSEWNQIEREDPMICESGRRFEVTKRRIMGELSIDDENELFDAMQGVVAAYTNAAMLFGMQTASALHEAVAQPTMLSQYNLDCLTAIEERAK